MVARVRAEAFTRGADRRLNALLMGAPRVGAWTRAADRRLNRALVAAWPRLAAVGRRGRAVLAPPARWAGRRLRPLGVLALRLLARVERLLLRTNDLARRAATRGSAVLTPQRAICLTIVASAGCLVAAQFVDYRAVEIGGPAYESLPAAAPTVAPETAGSAHAYLLVPVALLAAAMALAAMRNPRRRGLGRIVFGLGLLSLAVILLIDLPAGLDADAQSAQFAGATAVLYDGFYAEIAAAAGLMLGGALLSRKPHEVRHRHGYRPRKPSLARTQGGRRRARTSSA